MVDAAVDAFVPACVFNNKKGKDERWLKAFKERAWNNPVVRIVSADHKDVVPGVKNNWTLAGITGAMVAALRQTKREIPAYLTLLAAEEGARKRGVETAVFGMS